MTPDEETGFIARKRPAVSGLIEDIIGPTALMDQLISANPPPDEVHPSSHDQVKDKNETK